MKKIAIFTEGQTEQIFVLRYLTFFGGHLHLFVRTQRLGGGGKVKAYTMELGEIGSPDEADYYFLLIDCGNDERVATAISDQYATMVGAGFEAIIAIRDLYPDIARAELPLLEQGFASSVPQAPLVPVLIASIMEVEAWFIAENSHFARLNASWTPARILQELGIDVAADSEAFDHPAGVIDAVHRLDGGEGYSKRRAEVEAIVGALDFSIFAEAAAARSASATRFIEVVAAALTP